VLLAALIRRLPPRAENHLRGRLSDLESLKSGKDRTKTRVRLLVHSIESPTKSSILRGPLKTKRRRIYTAN
jgi:hypothetical protein